VKRTLIVRPPAEADFESAFRWYQEQNLGLGAEFIRAVDAVLASIVREPEAYPVVYRQSRRALLRRFPYAVYFLADAEQVEVAACLHFRRHPRRLRSRL
jgi:plasmid stabilization system protein ParE